MKKLLTFVIATAALTSPVFAADMSMAPPPPPPPAPTWTGFYIGGTVGGGWATSSQTDSSGTTSGDYNQSGFIGGGTLGYNWQWQNVLLGAEADISWSDVKGSVNLPGLCTAGGGSVCFSDIQWLTTERARFGVVVSNWLLYATVGVAGMNVHTGQQSCATPVSGAAASCGTPTVWNAVGGLGAEVMLAPRWSAKVEWLYTGFANQQAYTVAIPVNVKESNLSIVRAGLNWHF